MAVAVVPLAKRHHPLADAIRESTRFELFNVAVMLFCILTLVLTFPISWAGHNAGPQMQVSVFGTFVVFAVCVWHSAHVKGRQQTVAFFRKDRTTHRLIHVVPLLDCGWMFLATFLAGLEMTWYDPGLVQAVMVGVFTTCPVIMLGVLKFAKDYWTAPSQ